MSYDITIWEQIRTLTERKTYDLEQTIKSEISRDRSLQEFHGMYPVSWQLTEILAQRADGWIQRLYQVCCNAHGQEASLEFDRAIWAYFMHPFIMQEVQVTEEGYRASRLLELLLCAVGSLPENRRQLKVGQKDCCVQVKTRLYDKWYAKLHHVPSKMDEAAAAMGRYKALEERAARIVRGLPLAPSPSSPSPSAAPITPLAPEAVQPSQAVPPSSAEQSTSEDPATSPPTSGQVSARTTIEIAPRSWNNIEISFLSDERVQIRDGQKSETRNYAEFGFEDGRSEKPNLAWETLRTLAEQNGTLRQPTRQHETWPHVEKRIQDIRKVLRQYFDIPSDPIPYIEGTGYQVSFKIRCRRSYNS